MLEDESRTSAPPEASAEPEGAGDPPPQGQGQGEPPTQEQGGGQEPPTQEQGGGQEPPARGFLSRVSSRFFGGVGIGSVFSLRVVLEVISAAIMLVVVVLAVTLWWLVTHPTQISLTAFSDNFPTLRGALSDSLANLTGQEEAKIGEIALIWDTGDFWFVQLHAEDVELRARDGSLSGRLTAIDAKASVRDFLRGQATIPFARIDGLTIPLHLDVEATPDNTTQTQSEAQEIASRLPADFSFAAMDFGDIQEIILSDFRLLLAGRSGVPLASPLAGDLIFRRSAEGSGFAIRGLLAEPAGEGLGSGTVDFNLAYTPPNENSSSTQIEWHFSGFNAARWSPHIALLEQIYPNLGDVSSRLDGLRLSLASAGSVWFSQSAESPQLNRADFSLSGSPGTIDLRPFYKEPMPVFAFTTEGKWRRTGTDATLFSDSADLALRLNNLLLGDLDATGPTITAELAIKLGATTTAETSFTIADLSNDWFRRLWRTQDLAQARSWVVRHIHEGVGQTAEGTFTISHSPEQTKLTSLDSSFSLSDVRLTYYDSLPEVRTASATGQLTLDALTFSIPQAESAGMAITNAEVVIAPRNNDGNWWRSAVTVTGESQAEAPLVRDFLESDPLRLLSNYGLNAPEVSGVVASQFRIALPLKSRLTGAEIAINTTSDLRDFRWQNLYGNLGLTQATARVAYDKGALSVAGQGAPFASDAPAETPPQGAISFEWQKHKNKESLDLSFQKLDSDILRQTKGTEALLASVRFFGTLDGKLTTEKSDATSSTLSGELTLTDLALTPVGLNWNKPRGEETTLKFRATNRAGVWRNLWLDDFSGTVTAPEIPTRARATIDEESFRTAYGQFAVKGGTLTFAEDAGLRAATFDSVHLGRIDLLGVTLNRDAEGATEIRADQARSLSLFRSRGTKESSTPELTSKNAGSKGVRLLFPQIGRLYTDEHTWLQNATLELTRTADGAITRFVLAGRIPDTLLTDSERTRWQRRTTEASATENTTKENATEEPTTEEADLPPWREVSIRYRATDDGWQADWEMNPFGAGLRALAFTDKVRGGTFRATGVSPAPWPQSPLELKATATQFQVLDLNAFVQLVSLLSLTGVIESLTSDGVSFNNLETEIALAEDQVIVRDFFMAGERLGLTASGTTSLQGQNSEIQGAVVPAYLFNNLVSKIPLIGTILSGGEEREGVFAINYKITGALAEPQVASNPASAIAPGFLRRLFGGGARPIKEGEEPPAKE